MLCEKCNEPRPARATRWCGKNCKQAAYRARKHDPVKAQQKDDLAYRRRRRERLRLAEGEARNLERKRDQLELAAATQRTKAEILRLRLARALR